MRRPDSGDGEREARFDEQNKAFALPEWETVLRSLNPCHGYRDVNTENIARSFLRIEDLEGRALVGDRAKLDERLLLTVTQGH